MKVVAFDDEEVIVASAVVEDENDDPDRLPIMPAQPAENFLME